MIYRSIRLIFVPRAVQCSIVTGVYYSNKTGGWVVVAQLNHSSQNIFGWVKSKWLLCSVLSFLNIGSYGLLSLWMNSLVVCIRFMRRIYYGKGMLCRATHVACWYKSRRKQPTIPGNILILPWPKCLTYIQSGYAHFIQRDTNQAFDLTA